MLGDGQGQNEFLDLSPHRDDAGTYVIACRTGAVGPYGPVAAGRGAGIVSSLIEHWATRFTKCAALAAFL